MIKNFIIIRTPKGRRYAQKIANSILWLNENRYPKHDFYVKLLTINEFEGESMQGLSARDTLLHPRAANPKTSWTDRLREWQDAGFKVVNSVDTIELTANKLACALHLQDTVPHPKSWEWNKKDGMNLKTLKLDNILDNLWDGWGNDKYIIAKPLTSLSQGAHVRKININDFWDIGAEFIRGDELVAEIERVPGSKVVIQEFFPYTSMHRVIVIGGKALPYTFVDKVSFHPANWKVSCCLNRTSMILDENPNPEILAIAELTQKAVEGVINFIDIFENENANDYYEKFSISEINTACSLIWHEHLAKEAGRIDWNIHFRIARELVNQAMEA